MILQITGQTFSSQELLSCNDIESVMLHCYRIQMEEVVEGKLRLVRVLILAQEIHTLLRWQNKCSTHGMSHNQRGFHGHSDLFVVEMQKGK